MAQAILFLCSFSKNDVTQDFGPVLPPWRNWQRNRLVSGRFRVQILVEARISC